MSAEPLPPPRIGHKEREQAVEALADHYASGRLDGDEYSERVALAWEARIVPDLQTLFSDLPEPRPDVVAGPPAAHLVRAVPTPPGPVRAGSPDPYAPWGRDPHTGVPYSDKNKIVAGVLQLVLPFGIGRFYSGHTGIAVAQLLVTLLTFGFGAIWSFVDGIVLLAGDPKDPDNRPMRT